jgi:hypothetical protein
MNPALHHHRHEPSTTQTMMRTMTRTLQHDEPPPSPVGRKVGQRVRQICQVLQDIGPSGRASIRDHMPDIEPSNMGKYCARAVVMGLLTVEPGLGHKSNYSVYAAAPNWRERADQRGERVKAMEQRELVEREQAPKSCWSGISSIFQLGASGAQHP